VDPALDALIRSAARREGLIGLAGGLPSARQFPKRALAEAFARALSTPASAGSALQYGWPEGQDRLRAQIAAGLAQRGLKIAPADIVITHGAQQALTLAIDCVGRRGDWLVADEVSYPSALQLFRARGLRLDALDSSKLRQARLAYVMPVVSNPTGQSLLAAERRRLLARNALFIIEDDAYAELAFAGPPGRPLWAEAPERTFHIGTFSKVLCPGLRVGWLVMPPRFRQRVRELKEATDLQAGTLSQIVVSDYLTRHDFAERVARLRRYYARRAERLAEALSKHAPFWRWAEPAGGFSIWVETDSEVAETPFLRAALKEGVSFDPGSLFRLTQATSPLGFRLCFSAAAPDTFAEGCRRLARAWRRVARR